MSATESTLLFAVIIITAGWMADGIMMRRKNRSLLTLLEKGSRFVDEAMRGVEKFMEERKVAAEYADMLLYERGPAALEEKIALEGACHKSAIYPVYIWMGKIHADEIHRRVTASMIMHFGSSDGRSASVNGFCRSPSRDRLDGFSFMCKGTEIMRVERNEEGGVNYITITPRTEEIDDGE